jgi:hypothetical protein
MYLGTDHGDNFGPKREEVTRGWRKLSNEELHNLQSSLVIRPIWMTTSWRMCGCAFSTHRSEERYISLYNLVGEYFSDLSVHVKIILRQTLRKYEEYH